jgi:hypothetical protein
MCSYQSIVISAFEMSQTFIFAVVSILYFLTDKRNGSVKCIHVAVFVLESNDDINSEQ